MGDDALCELVHKKSRQFTKTGYNTGNFGNNAGSDPFTPPYSQPSCHVKSFCVFKVIALTINIGHFLRTKRSRLKKWNSLLQVTGCI